MLRHNLAHLCCRDDLRKGKRMEVKTKRRLLIALALGAALLGGGALVTSVRAEQPESGWRPPWLSGAALPNAASVARLLDIDESPVAAGTLDDGEELLPQAKLTV